jgi:hypothetical protein
MMPHWPLNTISTSVSVWHWMTWTIAGARSMHDCMRNSRRPSGVTSPAGRSMTMAAKIRMSEDGSITIVQEEDGTFHCASQEEMETLEVGEDLTEEDLALLDD